ncbi:hypothetical protein EMPG_09301 [Blastomyces silverae]|uniref:Altered inheritance of mitochondria protein 9, mitochondrial n=1 Tax=Blastomyces silverae TaxID=2060906 RepID=A0A0H1B4S0_9EURO|nr:hypothetical protein EMPG_09301 [Blastomyces silverae]
MGGYLSSDSRMYQTERDLRALIQRRSVDLPQVDGSRVSTNNLQCRYVKFDMPTLLELAASAIGSKFCVRVVKISEGQYSKVFLLTMSDGREVIAKLPNPNAGRPRFTTAIPRAHAWSSRALENSVGAEYIIMEKQADVMLSDVWESMKGKQKAQIVLQVVDIEKTLASTKFAKFGASYCKNDLPATLDTMIPLCVDRNGNEVHSAKSEQPMHQFYGTAICICKMFLSIPKSQPISWVSLTGNLSVSVHFSCKAHAPVSWITMAWLLRNCGKSVSLRTLTQMTPHLHEQQKAKALHQAQTLHNLYLARSCQVNTEAFQAMQGQDSLRHKISVVPGLTLTDYEPCLSSLLRDVEREWSKIVGVGSDGLPLVPCPLQFSAAEVQQQEQDEELWARDVELMNNFISDTGCYKHLDGRVSDADYELSKRETTG